MKYCSIGTTIWVRVIQPTDVDPFIRLEVEDEGIGIPAADLPFVLEPFRRGSNVDGATPGTGLGLAGVRQIVVEHGGTIDVRSAEGHGTTVVVRLPVAELHSGAWEQLNHSAFVEPRSAAMTGPQPWGTEEATRDALRRRSPTASR